MKEALFIGRFQPFHYGHYADVQHILQQPDIERLTIGIGSSNVPQSETNPFSVEERRLMLEAVLPSDRVVIDEIPDVGNYKVWTKAVMDRYPQAPILFSGNPLLHELFGEAGWEVRTPPHVPGISATTIRNRMISKRNWLELVPPAVAEIVKTVDGVERLRDIYCKFLRPGVTADAIVQYGEKGLVVIDRLHPPFKGRPCWPGGYLNYGTENAQGTAARELGEETGLWIPKNRFKQVGEYSDPDRDPRGHVISLAYFTRIEEGQLKAGDDAARAYVVPFAEMPYLRMGFDHSKMYRDVMNKIMRGEL